MASYVIEGGKRLEGETYVSGSKNASLPIIAASILNKGTSTLYNVPNIYDTNAIRELGAEIEEDEDVICCNTECLSGTRVYLPIASVGATENIMMAAVLAERRNYYIKCSNGTGNSRFAEFLEQNGS